MSKPIYIHAGCHRTGTSSFQLCLDANRDVLQAMGYDLAYPGRDGIPGGKLRLRLPGPRHKPKDLQGIREMAQEALKNRSPDRSKPLILSEENIPGRMFHFFQGQFFPAADARFETLAQALGDRPEHILYVVRPYSQLYVSAYRKRAEANAVKPFDEAVQFLMEMDRGLPEMLCQMKDVLNPRRMTIIPYEKRGQSRDLLCQLVPGLSRDDLVEPQATVNLSATDSTLDELQRHYRAGEKLNHKQWRRIMDRHADTSIDTGFASLTPSEAGDMDALYQSDLAQLRDIPGLTVL